MNHTSYMMLAASFASTLFMTVSAAEAATAKAHTNTDQAEQAEIERVQVTGQNLSTEAFNRSVFSLQQQPQSVHVVTRDIIDNQLSVDLSDVVRNVSGIQGKATHDLMGMGLSGDYLIRGLWSESYLNSRQTFLNVGLDPATLVNIEQVEVLKGSAATFFAGGYGAPNGGIINMREKMPQSEPFSSLMLSLGSYGSHSIGFDVNRAVNDDWALRVTGETADRQIVIDDITQQVDALFPTLYGQFGNTSVTVRGRYQDLEYDYYHGLNGAFDAQLNDQQVIVSTATPSFSNVASGRLPTSQATSYGLDIRVEQQWHEHLKGVFTAGYQDADDHNHYVFFVTDTGSLQQDAKVQDISAEIHYTTQLGGLEARTIFYAANNRTDMTFLDTYNSANFGEFITPIEGEYQTASLGLMQEWHVTPSVRLSGALSRAELTLDYAVAETANPGIDTTDTHWRAGVSWDANSVFTLFAGHSYGSRLPTPTVVASAFFTDMPELESTKQQEIGVKFQAPQYGLSGSIVGFDNTLLNAAESIDFVPLQLDQESSGVDLDVQWQINAAWVIMANATVLDATIVEPGDYQGNRPFNLPEQFGRIALQYTPSDVWQLNLGVSFGDERAGGVNNSYFTESYQLVDMQLAYVQPTYRVQLGVDNLLDATHFEPVMFFGGGYFDQTQPRSFSLKLTYEW